MESPPSLDSVLRWTQKIKLPVFPHHFFRDVLISLLSFPPQSGSPLSMWHWFLSIYSLSTCCAPFLGQPDPLWWGSCRESRHFQSFSGSGNLGFEETHQAQICLISKFPSLYSCLADWNGFSCAEQEVNSCLWSSEEFLSEMQSLVNLARIKIKFISFSQLVQKYPHFFCE